MARKAVKRSSATATKRRRQRGRDTPKRGNAPQAESTTVSTRFDEQELPLLKQATGIKGWSLARLVRIGAYEKAANIVNAAGDSVQPVRALLGKVVHQLFSAQVRFLGDSGSELSEDDRDEVLDSFSNVTCESESLSEATFKDFLKIVRSFGADLAPLLEDEFRRSQATKFDLLTGLIDPTSASNPTASPSNPSEAKSEED